MPVPAADLAAGVLSDSNLLALARSSRLLRRVTTKLSPKVLLGSCLGMVGAGSSSFFSLAGLAGVFADRSISRQAVARRFGDPLRDFLRALLVQVMGVQCAARAPVLAMLGPVRRILIQDSTTMKLHASLATHFPGSANACGGGAALKIQATLDLLAHSFVDFTLSGFTRNDQAAAPDVLAHLRAGDLVLRDLGYLTLESLRAIDTAAAFFVSRYSKMCVFRTDGTEFSLGGLLLEKKHAPGACVDMPVLLGKAALLPVRLVAIKLDAATAAERRRKALANRDKRMKPTAESLALLDWAIYVTNLPRAEFSAPKISALYGLRWRVEIVFKSFKSAGLRLPELLEGRKSKTQVEVLTHAALILAVFNARLSTTPEPGERKQTTTGKAKAPRSLLKSAKLVSLLLLPLLLQWLAPPGLSLRRRLHLLLTDHACYDSRKRTNFIETLAKTLALS